MLRKSISIVLVMLACLSLAGCSMGAQDETLPVFTAPAETTVPAFDEAPLLSIHTDAAFETTVISTEELGGHFDRGIKYEGVTNVTLDIDGTAMKLEEAIRDGHITPAQLFAYARLDAEKGFCTESYRAGRTGLTAFVYTYPDADLWMVYDVLAAPDGQQHLIQDFRIFRPGGSKSESPGSYLDLETYTRLDREDWGITLEIVEISPTSITLNCAQSGGQQIGQLHMYAYSISGNQGPIDEPVMVDYSTDLQMNSTTELVFDWSELYGSLPSGEYRLIIALQDVYDFDQVHPLMVNYTDYQDYEVTFSIP